MRAGGLLLHFFASGFTVGLLVVDWGFLRLNRDAVSSKRTFRDC